MIIEGNEKEIEAMEQFHKGNRQEGLRLQEKFAAAFREEYKDKDHCPCKKACRYHGNCKECVAIHRAHQEHVPNCMRPIIKQLLFSLTAVLTLPTAKAGGFASPATVIKSVTLNLKKVSHAELRFPLRSYALLIQITALSLH